MYVMATNNMSGQWSHVDPPQRPVPLPMMKQRKDEAAAGAQELGTTPIHLDHPQRHYNDPNAECVELRYGCSLPDGVPENVPTILTAHEDPAARQRLVDLILEHAPEYILTHGPIQQDMEHVGTCLLVTKAYWEAVDAGHEGGLLYWRSGFTIAGPLNCQWGTFIDISGLLERKMALVGKHVCQMPAHDRPDHPTRKRALAWGTANNCQAAEVFVIANPHKRPVQHKAFGLEIIAHMR